MAEKISVLCIDDEDKIRFALEAVIKSQGWQAITAKNIREAERIIKKKMPTLILIDYHMPEINGLEGVKIIRGHDEDVPIIVFTIDSDLKLAEEFMEAGATDFATKPIKAPDLISRINLHIKLLGENFEANNDFLSDDILLPKGIGRSTLNSLLESLQGQADYLTVEEISELTGLSYQTTYRYLQFLESEEIIEVMVNYGKIGRPKQRYKLLRD
ncbi:MAG: response regulator [Bacillota bacterium]|nr:response regulator [Bacillota bacterium]